MTDSTGHPKSAGSKTSDEHAEKNKGSKRIIRILSFTIPPLQLL